MNSHFKYCHRHRVLYSKDARQCPLCPKPITKDEIVTAIAMTVCVIVIATICLVEIWKR